MNKLFSIFAICAFMNVSTGFGAYFYASSVEEAIESTFPEEVWADVGAEYEAQINQEGEIDTEGLENVCYAGGLDPSTETGAEGCDAFVQKMVNSCPYAASGYVYDKQGNKITTDTRELVDYYNNPQTDEERLRKCIVDETVDWVIKKKEDGGGNEGGFQQTPSDLGNRICDKYGNIQKDKNTGKPLLGATKYGITTCHSMLSVKCIKNMTKDDAKRYYYTRMYMKMRYYLLPIDVQALLLEMSVSGIGYAGKAFRCALDGEPSLSVWNNYPVMTNKPLTALYNWAKTNNDLKEYDSFKRRYTGVTLVNNRNCVPVYSDRRKRAYNNLSKIYETCASKLNIPWSPNKSNDLTQ